MGRRRLDGTYGTGTSQMLALRVTDEAMDGLRAEAEEQGASISEIARRRLERRPAAKPAPRKKKRASA